MTNWRFIRVYIVWRNETAAWYLLVLSCSNAMAIQVYICVYLHVVWNTSYSFSLFRLSFLFLFFSPIYYIIIICSSFASLSPVPPSSWFPTTPEETTVSSISSLIYFIIIVIVFRVKYTKFVAKNNNILYMNELNWRKKSRMCVCRLRNQEMAQLVESVCSVHGIQWAWDDDSRD